jgi:hypothetical protein
MVVDRESQVLRYRRLGMLGCRGRSERRWSIVIPRDETSVATYGRCWTVSRRKTLDQDAFGAMILTVVCRIDLHCLPFRISQMQRAACT